MMGRFWSMSWCAASLAVLLPVHASAQAERPVDTVGGDGTLRRVLYTMKVKGAKDAEVVVRVPRGGLDAGAERLQADGCRPSAGLSVEAGDFVWRCRLTGAEATLAFAVSGNAATTSAESLVTVAASVGEAAATFDQVQALRAAVDSTLFQTVFGGGIANLQDDHEDFTKSGNALLVTNDSEFRASGLVGGLFRLGTMPTRFWGRKQVSLLASFQFTQGTQSLLDGTFFGVGVELNPYLHATLGGGLRKGKELSPGFRQAAYDSIQSQIAAGNAGYLRFKDYTVANRDEALLDGLPLTTPGATAPFFPGEPIVDSYNWSYFVGISVPVKLTDLLGPKKGG